MGKNWQDFQLSVLSQPSLARLLPQHAVFEPGKSQKADGLTKVLSGALMMIRVFCVRSRSGATHALVLHCGSRVKEVQGRLPD